MIKYKVERYKQTQILLDEFILEYSHVSNYVVYLLKKADTKSAIHNL